MTDTQQVSGSRLLLTKPLRDLPELKPVDGRGTLQPSWGLPALRTLVNQVKTTAFPPLTCSVTLGKSFLLSEPL